MKERGQFSVEYLIVSAFGIMVITVIAFVVYSEFGRQTAEVDMAQLQRFGNSIINAVSKISYLGETSVITINPLMPAGLKNASVVGNRTLSFTIESNGKLSDAPFQSPVNIAADFGSFSKGPKNIIIRSKMNYVLVCTQENNKRCNNYCDHDSGEDALNSPNDCCTADCSGCTENGPFGTCVNDGCYLTCYGHNGCNKAC